MPPRPGMCVSMLAVIAGLFAIIPNEFLKPFVKFVFAAAICVLGGLEIFLIFKDQKKRDEEQSQRDIELTTERKTNQERFELSIAELNAMHDHLRDYSGQARLKLMQLLG